MLACTVQVSELQGSVQELQEALDQETTANRDSQATLEEAYHHRKTLEASLHALERELVQAQASSKPDKADAPPGSVGPSTSESKAAGTSTSGALSSGSADTAALKQQASGLADTICRWYGALVAH